MTFHRAKFRKRGDASGAPDSAQLSEAKMSTDGVATRQDPSNDSEYNKNTDAMPVLLWKD